MDVEGDQARIEAIEGAEKVLNFVKQHDPAAFEVGFSLGEAVFAILCVGGEITGLGGICVLVEATEGGLGGESIIGDVCDCVSVFAKFVVDLNLADL